MSNLIGIVLAVLITTSFAAGFSLLERPRYWHLSLGMMFTAGAAVLILAELAWGSVDLNTATALFGFLLIAGTIHLMLVFALLIAHASERKRRESDRQHAACLAERKRRQLNRLCR